MLEPVSIPVDDDVFLSPVQPADRDRCVALINDEDIARVMLRIPHPYGPDDFDNFAQISASAAELHEHPLHFGIRHRQHGLVGGFGYEALSPGHCVEIGYWLGKPYWGRGIMTQVVDAGCRYAIETWNVARVSAHVFVFNPASARVLEKAGFEFEGVIRRKFRKQEQFIDARLYARLSDLA